MPQISRIPGLRRLPQVLGPIREDVVLFESWRGQFSDNPRAIAEELHRRGSALEQVWVLDPALGDHVPDWVVPVAPHSREHLEAMGSARYLVANSTVLGFHHKRRGQTFLQTWHGTPLKKIGFHIRRSRQAERTLRRNVPNWDLLVSPNGFSTPILRDAFGYEGQVLETGYPRNDLLAGPEAPDVRARVRHELGLDRRERVVLYAPTFRDGAPFGREADVQRLAALLGDGHVVLLRAHKLDADGIGLDDAGRVRDVSLHPDNRELYLAADVLVTDYSSLMFDFAVTRKPIVFFTPDLADYRDEVRGFYFDFEAEAPGPLLSTVDEVAEAVRDVAGLRRAHAAAYSRFVERFCHLDDGGASARVVDAVFGDAVSGAPRPG